MHILNRGSLSFKDYFNYEPGEVVLYLRPVYTIDHGESGGIETVYGDYYIVGSFFDKDDEERKPPTVGFGVRRFDFPDGTYAMYDSDTRTFYADFGDKHYVKYNAETGDLMIDVAGDVYISGGNIHLN